MRGPNPPKVITGEEEAGGGRNVLIHYSTHPLPLISFRNFTTVLYWGGGKGAGRRLPPAAGTSLADLLREAPESCTDPGSLLSAAACDRRTYLRAVWARG